MEVIMKVLIQVDIQNDFCKGGNLAVPEGELIIAQVNQMQKEYEIIVATQDFHPKNHKSFASNNPGKNIGDLGELNGQVQVMWPDHCVQNTFGSEFHPMLDMSKVSKVFTKGVNVEVDSYSGFFDNDKKSSTGLGEWLKEKGVREVHIVGLALDYCVKATALDSAGLGFKTKVFISATKAVNLNPDDGSKAVEEMKSKGVEICE